VNQLNSVRNVIIGLQPGQLTPSEERALSALFEALLALARARQRHVNGPLFPSLAEAARLGRRR
jgi:hypothetical protein